MQFHLIYILICFQEVLGCFHHHLFYNYKNFAEKKFEYQNYWKLPFVTLENASEEAVMLIGGL